MVSGRALEIPDTTTFGPQRVHDARPGAPQAADRVHRATRARSARQSGRGAKFGRVLRTLVIECAYARGGLAVGVILRRTDRCIAPACVSARCCRGPNPGSVPLGLRESCIASSSARPATMSVTKRSRLPAGALACSSARNRSRYLSGKDGPARGLRSRLESEGSAAEGREQVGDDRSLPVLLRASDGLRITPCHASCLSRSIPRSVPRACSTRRRTS